MRISGKRASYFTQYAHPISNVFLSEKPDRRIPGAILAVEQPAPIRIERQHDPAIAAHTARKMRKAGIHGNDQIHLSDERSGIFNIRDFSIKDAQMCRG